MSNELIPIPDVLEMAKAVARSGYFPAFGTPEKAFTLMMVAQAEGCHPMQAVQRYDVIGGKPSKKSDAMLADFQRLGGKVTWDVLTDKEVKATFDAPGLGKPVTISWTIEMAQAAKLSGKDNWRSYPRQMLRSRVVSEGIRTAMPGVVAGLYTPEEVQDFSPMASASAAPAQTETPVVVDAQVVTPAAPPVDENRAKALRGMFAAIKEAGIVESERKVWMSEQLGHSVETSKSLSDTEVTALTKLAREYAHPMPTDDEPGARG
jgi:hypothetical protein